METVAMTATSTGFRNLLEEQTLYTTKGKVISESTAMTVRFARSVSTQIRHILMRQLSMTPIPPISMLHGRTRTQ